MPCASVEPAAKAGAFQSAPGEGPRIWEQACSLPKTTRSKAPPHASEGSEAGCDDAQGSRGYASGCPGGAVSDGCERAAGEEQGDGVDQPRRPGRYQLRCDAAAERYGLSPRERDVFDLLVRGRSIEYIAQSLTISFNTAKSHIRHIYVKADVHSRQELQELLDREE